MSTQPECQIVAALKEEVARLQAYVQELYAERVEEAAKEPADEVKQWIL
jgi:hypothetical protein